MTLWISAKVVLSQAELLAHRLPEMPANLVPIIEDIWLTDVVGRAEYTELSSSNNIISTGRRGPKYAAPFCGIKGYKICRKNSKLTPVILLLPLMAVTLTVIIACVNVLACNKASAMFRPLA